MAKDYDNVVCNLCEVILKERIRMDKVISNNNTIMRYIVPFYIEHDKKIYGQLEGTDVSGVVSYEELVKKFQSNTSDSENGDLCITKSPQTSYKKSKPSKIEKDLYEYIYDQIGIVDGITTKELGCVYEKNNDNEPGNLGYKLSEDKKFIFKVTNYKIYLFKTGVNFFCYDIEINGNYELCDIVEFQNVFKELVRKDCIKSASDEKYRGAEVIHKELSNIFATYKVRYYSEREITIDSVKTKVIDKPILYSYVSVVDQSKLSDEYYKSAYYLSTGFNGKYEYNEGKREKAFRPFNNIIWEISKEGCCGLSVVENDNHYLYSGFKTRVKNDYFLLYILILHQSYAMLDLSNMIAKELPADYESYDDGEGKLYETIKKIKLRLNVFLARNVYTSVSHVQQHNEFYDYAIRRLNIEHDIQSVRAGLSALEKMLQMNKEKYEQKVKEENSRKIKTLIAIMTLVNTISISLNLNEFMDEIKKFFDQQTFNVVSLSGLKLLLQVILWGFAIFICYLAVSSKRDKGEKLAKHNRKKKKTMKKYH